MSTPTISELMAAPLNISKGHACDILNPAQKRSPSLALAIAIYRHTGWKHARLRDLTEADIDVLERVEAMNAA